MNGFYIVKFQMRQRNYFGAYSTEAEANAAKEELSTNNDIIVNPIIQHIINQTPNDFALMMIDLTI